MRIWRGRFSLYVWDMYYPADFIDRVRSRHHSIEEAVAAVKPPPCCPPGPWAWRVEDRWTGQTAAGWSSAVPPMSDHPEADPQSRPSEHVPGISAVQTVAAS